jgi:hypothetical protein
VHAGGELLSAFNGNFFRPELARRPGSAQNARKIHIFVPGAKFGCFRLYPPTMPNSRCPVCPSKHVQWLSGLSKHAQADYCRCGDCGHVWNVPKDNPDDPPHHVTPLPEEPV